MISVDHALDGDSDQRQLLLDPFQPALWARLDASVNTPAVVDSLGVVAAAVNLQSDPTSTLCRLAWQPGEAFAPYRWQPRFHPVGSAQADAVREHQLRTFQDLMDGGQLELLLRRLDQSTVSLLAERLSPVQSYALGQRAYEQQLYLIAAPLLERVVSAPSSSLDVLPWALFFRALNQRALGNIHAATQMLEELLNQDQLHGQSPAWADVSVHAQIASAWLNLSLGNRSEADALLMHLRSSCQDPGVTCELDLLGRVLATLHWLEAHSRDALSATEDRALRCRVMIALDSIQMSSCGSLLKIRGWLVDPGHQLKELCLVRGHRVWRLDLGQARYTHRPDLADVVELCGGSSDCHAGLELIQVCLGHERVAHQPGEAAELFVLLSNGDQFCLRRGIETVELSTELIRSLLDSAIQKPCSLVSPGLLYRARNLWREFLASRLRLPADYHQFGNPVETPELSVIVPLYGRLDFMEYQLNWFHAWRRRRESSPLEIQLIYVLDDPQLTHECMALAQRCHILYEMPFELVVNRDNLGFAAANNRGSEYAKAPLILLLNSDVLPAHDYSFDMMMMALRQADGQAGAIGAQLLFDNESIQHLGMEFVQDSCLEGELSRVWLNDHPFKGIKIPSILNSDSALEEVEAVTAACLLLSRQLFTEVAGLSMDYIVGDFEDSDLCLKLRQRGLAILIEKAACFYHLERQSVGLVQANSDLKMKLVAANAITHHQTWCSSIERLKLSEVSK